MPKMTTEAIARYVYVQKLCVPCFLLATFIGIGVYDIWLTFTGHEVHFFETIYTVLIFADIAMVLDCPTLYALLLRGFPQFRLRGGHIADAPLLPPRPCFCSATAVFCRLLRARAQLWRQLLRPQAED